MSEHLEALRAYIEKLEAENRERIHDRAKCAREMTELRKRIAGLEESCAHWIKEWHALHLEIEALRKGEE